MRLGSGSVDRCSWLFQWARILFVVAMEVRQESLLVESEKWQQKLFKLNQDIIRGCAPIADKDVYSFNDSKKFFHTCLANGNRNASVVRQLLKVLH